MSAVRIRTICYPPGFEIPIRKSLRDPDSRVCVCVGGGPIGGFTIRLGEFQIAVRVLCPHVALPDMVPSWDLNRRIAGTSTIRRSVF